MTGIAVAKTRIAVAKDVVIGKSGRYYLENPWWIVVIMKMITMLLKIH